MAVTDLDYAKVIGRFALTVADTPDPDDDPDIIWCDEGTVKIEPLQTYTKVAGGADGPFTAGNSIIEATIGADGRLSHLGKSYIHVVDLTSPKVNPQIGPNKATHRVTFVNVKAGGTRVDFPMVEVRLTKDGPDGDGVNDLTELMPVLPGASTPIYRGEKGVGVLGAAIVDGDQLQLELTDGTTLDAGTLPAGPGGSNAGVAGYIENDGPTKSALLASYGQIIAWAKIPESLVAGALTYDTAGLLTSAAAVWPDGATGVLMIVSRQAGTTAVTSYTVTRVVSGQPTKTYTQPTITRDSSGNATTVPQITVV